MVNECYMIYGIFRMENLEIPKSSCVMGGHGLSLSQSVGNFLRKMWRNELQSGGPVYDRQVGDHDSTGPMVSECYVWIHMTIVFVGFINQQTSLVGDVPYDHHLDVWG